MTTHRARWKRLWMSLPPLTRAWLLSFLCWGIVALSMGIEVAARAQRPWMGAVWPGIRDWLPWAILTPLIFMLVDRLPIDRQRWRLALPVQILCGAVAVILCQYWKLEVDKWFGMTPRMMFAPPPIPGGAGPMLPGGPGPGLLPPGGPFDMLRLATFELPIYLMLASGAHTLTYYRRTQERESSLALARSEAQKMQLQPHFLFNTLNMIAELVYEEPEKADAMLVALSGLLRLTMETAGEQELPLRRELEFIERYLKIMHARFEDRIKFQFGIDPATYTALVPTFLLQPLVENAVEHGLGPRMSGGLISIRARRVGDLLHLCVADNGVGFNGEKRGPEGLGLGNTRNRLRELYGDAGRLDLQDSGGLIVEISLPFHQE
jgi:two-component system, LytTR family, sensor kinase